MAADTAPGGTRGAQGPVPDTIIVGGGFAGSLLALKLAQAGIHPILIEAARQAGPGLAYRAAAPEHLLNVPVQRMEVGLSPSFHDWLGGFPNETVAAIVDAGNLADAFVPRVLFGRYLAGRVEAALAAGRLTRLRGEVTRIHKRSVGQYELTLADGRLVAAARIVLATGNLPPKAPDIGGEGDQTLTDSPLFVPDPWSAECLADLRPDAPVLLIGTGLTMADIAFSLHSDGHRGPIFVLSRRGLLPLAHAGGGAWPVFLKAGESEALSPLVLLRRIRKEARAAIMQGVPWQRVMDVVRPLGAQIWAGWSRAQRMQFLRHLRPFWDVHRHRLPPRVARALQGLIDSGQLMPLRGRLKRFAHRDDCVDIAYAVRHRPEIRNIKVERVINCTGPRTDFAGQGTSLYADLRAQGLIHADRLALGLETSDVRVIDAHGQISDSLFAVGGLTRPAWWEITAVPEIAVQISRLAHALSQDAGTFDSSHRAPSLAHDFSDIGAGI